MTRAAGLVGLELFSLLALLTGCASTEPAPAAAPAKASPDSSAQPSPSTEPAKPEASTEGEPARPRRPLQIANACGDVVTVVFGADPKAASAGGRTIAPGASIEGPRDKDGSQIVWLLDNAGAPLIKVHVSRGNKRVEIGRSCRTLDAS
jgi:hypothetical protein